MILFTLIPDTIDQIVCINLKNEAKKKMSAIGVLGKSISIAEKTIHRWSQQERVALVFFFCFLVPSHQDSFLIPDLYTTNTLQSPVKTTDIFSQPSPRSHLLSFYLSFRTGSFPVCLISIALVLSAIPNKSHKY